MDIGVLLPKGEEEGGDIPKERDVKSGTEVKRLLDKVMRMKLEIGVMVYIVSAYAR